MNSLFRQNGNNIYYEYVTITRGTNSETGLEEHQFIVTSDVQGTVVWGNKRHTRNANVQRQLE